MCAPSVWVARSWLDCVWPAVCTAMTDTSCMSSTPRGGSMVALRRKEANLIHFLCSLAFVRHFRCDCGNGKFPGFTCTLFPVSSRDGEGR